MSFWTDIANGEVALSVRNKINNLGNKVVSLWDKTVVSEPTLAKYGLGTDGTVDDVLNVINKTNWYEANFTVPSRETFKFPESTISKGTYLIIASATCLSEIGDVFDVQFGVDFPQKQIKQYGRMFNNVSVQVSAIITIDEEKTIKPWLYSYYNGDVSIRLNKEITRLY